MAAKIFEERWRPLSKDNLGESPTEAGVYVLAFSSKALKGKSVSAKTIFYVGMSNSKGGVRQRLKQFSNGIEYNDYHRPAMRFFKTYGGGKPFSKMKSDKKFYFATISVERSRDKKTWSPSDLRIMGLVACLEYSIRARILEMTGREAWLNVKGLPIPEQE